MKATLTLTFINNPVVEFAPGYTSNFSPNWHQNSQVTQAKLVSPQSHMQNKTISDAKTAIYKFTIIYLAKLSKYCTTQAPLKRTSKMTGLKHFTWSIAWRALSTLMIGVNMCSNAKGTLCMSFFMYNTCCLLLSLALITPRFNLHWVLSPCRIKQCPVPWRHHVKWQRY